MVPGDTRERGETRRYTSVKCIVHYLTEHGVSARSTRRFSGELPQSWLREHKWLSICQIGIRGAEWFSQVAYVGTKTNSIPSAPPKHAGPVNLSVSGAEVLYPRVSESRGAASVMHKVQSSGCAYRRLVIKATDSHRAYILVADEEMLSRMIMLSRTLYCSSPSA